jgi:hypothetical protein
MEGCSVMMYNLLIQQLVFFDACTAIHVSKFDVSLTVFEQQILLMPEKQESIVLTFTLLME